LIRCEAIDPDIVLQQPELVNREAVPGIPIPAACKKGAVVAALFTKILA
jgi:hypothetical protein